MKTTPTPPKQTECTEVSILFESEDEESEDEEQVDTVGKEEEKQLVEKIGSTIKATVEDTKDDGINHNTEDNAISRLELKEQEYLQEQEEAKGEVLGEDNTSGIMEEMMMERKMEEMMERKMKVRFDQKEADLKQRQTTSMDRMTQHANNQAATVR
jgi:hypothetical protein